MVPIGPKLFGPFNCSRKQNQDVIAPLLKIKQIESDDDDDDENKCFNSIKKALEVKLVD